VFVVFDRKNENSYIVIIVLAKASSKSPDQTKTTVDG
jgi:hypothetical protein